MIRTLIASLLLAAGTSSIAAPVPVPVRPTVPPSTELKEVQPVKPARKLLRIEPIAPLSNAVPRGSYLQSCGPASVDGDTLSATCLRRNGERHGSRISVSRCAGADISNYNRRLQCITPVRAHWGDTVLPPGSWTASCYGRVEGATLVAICRDGSSGTSVLGWEMSRAGIKDSRLDLSRCPDGADIANLRGYLTCVQ